MGYAAKAPTCGALLILYRAMKCGGPSRGQGLCSHLWVTADFVPHYKALGTPQTTRLCSQSAQFLVTDNFVSRYEALGTPKKAGIM